MYWYKPFDARPPIWITGSLRTYTAMPGTVRSFLVSTGTSSSADMVRSLRGLRRMVKRP